MAKLTSVTYEDFYEMYYTKLMNTNDIAKLLNVTGSSIVRKMRSMGFQLGGLFEVECSFCSKIVKRKKYLAFASNNFYCNQECETNQRKITMVGEGNPFYGKKHDEATKEVFSTIHKGKEIPLEVRKRISIALSGSNSPHWKDGSTERNRNDRMKMEYRAWRTSVFIRDAHTCGVCSKAGGKLEVHHIRNFADNVELRTNIDNGMTICQPCHNLFHKIYGKKDTNEYQMQEFKKSRCAHGLATG